MVWLSGRGTEELFIVCRWVQRTTLLNELMSSVKLELGRESAMDFYLADDGFATIEDSI